MTSVRKPARIRIARATRQLESMTRFYREGLGFALAEEFTGHAGYSGVILAMRDGVELELTTHERGRIVARPDGDDLLVLYLPSASHVDFIRGRLESLGHLSVEPLNPYWLDRSVTFEDPDGWRIVLCFEPQR
jgi:catechol 2,3-dioxygenase-like lactoylglutathione lyase family enzyme